MHNNIMAAGSKDRPPSRPGRYSQWRSRFLRYIDTKPNGEGLRKSILSGPYVPSTVLVQAVAATEGNPAIQQHTTIKTVLNMTPENKEHFLSEKEAIFLLLTGIGDDIYSTVDACKTANEMWIAIERLQQGESLNVQDVKTNLFWEFGKFTSRDGESMESYYSRDPEQAQRDKDMQKNLALLAKYFKKLLQTTNNNLRTSSKLRTRPEDTTLKAGSATEWDNSCFNCKGFALCQRNAKSQSLLKTLVYKEKMMMCKQAEHGVPLQAEQADWLADTDEEIDEQELEAHYRSWKRQQEILAPNREETMTLANESRSKLNKDYVKPYDYTKQNSLYEIFKAPSLEYLYQLERAKEVRKTMWRKPFVRTKPNIAKNVAFLPVSKSISKSRQVFNDMTFNINQFREIVDQAWFKHTSDYFRVPTAKDMEVLIKTLLMPLSIKTQNDSFRFEHELKTEMHEDYEYVKSLEKEVDELESEKADFSNIYDLLLEECVSKDVTCSYLHSLSDLNAYAELQCLYLHKVKECECLAQKLSKQTESVNKEVHNKLLKSFAKLENHSISLELALQQCKEQMKNNSVCKENGSNVFRKEREQYHEIQDLKAQMQDKNIAISELKKLIEKCKGKSVETHFDNFSFGSALEDFI
ncbi:hypothetical protein Tco_0529854 [Tanacetum coccineum]